MREQKREEGDEEDLQTPAPGSEPPREEHIHQKYDRSDPRKPVLRNLSETPNPFLCVHHRHHEEEGKRRRKRTRGWGRWNQQRGAARTPRPKEPTRTATQTLSRNHGSMEEMNPWRLRCITRNLGFPNLDPHVYIYTYMEGH